jgi:phosphoribosylanthranilate isomerase
MTLCHAPEIAGDYRHRLENVLKRKQRTINAVVAEDNLVITIQRLIAEANPPAHEVVTFIGSYNDGIAASLQTNPSDIIQISGSNEDNPIADFPKIVQVIKYIIIDSTISIVMRKDT